MANVKLHELRELYALIQVLKSAVTPPAGDAQTLAPLVASIDASVRALLDTAEENRK